ncbi:sensor histidine kinase [Lacibacterium aquatile]|uniref:histidine kinase n=1 Tax=Lacibacterium aquatile TaxID=1168082 RepID=A0ABW5E1M2_9PROT
MKQPALFDLSRWPAIGWLHWFGRSYITTLGRRLIVLLLVSATPVLFLIFLTTKDNRDLLLDHYRSNLRVLGESYDRKIAGIRSSLATLAVVVSDFDKDTERCNRALASAMQIHGRLLTNVYLVDSDNHVYCASNPALVGILALGSANQEVRETQLPSVTSFTKGQISGETVIALAYPLFDTAGNYKGAVSTAIRAEFFVSESAFALPEKAVFQIVDKNDRTLDALGKQVDAPLLPVELRRPAGLDMSNGTTRTVSHDDWVHVVTAVDEDFDIVLSARQADLAALANSQMPSRVLELFLYAGASLAAILIGARYLVVRPVAVLSREMRRYAEDGVYPERLESTVGNAPQEIRALGLSFLDMIEKVHDREIRLQNLIDQRDMLMRETHHRVKNNLQIIASIFSIQQSKITDEEAANQFQSAISRIRALSILHQHLYVAHNYSQVDAKDFIGDLVSQLTKLAETEGAGRIQLSTEIEPIILTTDQAVCLGLIINEAVTNAWKYAFQERENGRIDIRITSDTDEYVTCIIADDGVGIADAKANGKGLGTILMRGFATQLGTEIAIDTSDDGVTVRLRFPLRRLPPGKV